MKAITLTQPWATLVAICAKTIETRSWSTRYRGPLAIHAAKGLPLETARLAFTEPFKSALNSAGYKLVSQLPRGSIVATCNLVSVVGTRVISFLPYEWKGPDERIYRFGLSEPECDFGDFTPGRFAWLLADVQELPTPVPARGALGLWECAL